MAPSRPAPPARGRSSTSRADGSHTIRNLGDEPASAYVVYAGGAPAMEAFAREAAALAGSGPPAVADVLAAAERHGIEMTRPVPGLS